MAGLTIMIVGSLNRETPYFQAAHGTGISVYAFDELTAATTLLSEISGVDNPTYLSVAPSGGHVYANSEVFGWPEGLIIAYALEAGGKRLRAVNMQPSLGSITSYNSLDTTGRFLLVTNYGLGAEGHGPDRAVAVYSIRPDGGLAAPVCSVGHSGCGPHPTRQERPHPHCVRTTPDNRFAIVADLGLDALFAYPFDETTGQLGTPVHTPLPAGAGPRHFLFHPDGRIVFVTCELDSTVLSLRYDAATARFHPADRISAVPLGAPENHCADLQLHPNGQFVYVSNRGHDSIAIIAADADSGHLTPLAHIDSGGVTPRNLALDPSGRFLAVANQNSDRIVFFAVDGETGALAEARPPLPHGTPMCIHFVRLPGADPAAP